jgi:hypothetical protein
MNTRLLKPTNVENVLKVAIDGCICGPARAAELLFVVIPAPINMSPNMQEHMDIQSLFRLNQVSIGLIVTNMSK